MRNKGNGDLYPAQPHKRNRVSQQRPHGNIQPQRDRADGHAEHHEESAPRLLRFAQPLRFGTDPSVLIDVKRFVFSVG